MICLILILILINIYTYERFKRANGGLELLVRAIVQDKMKVVRNGDIVVIEIDT